MEQELAFQNRLRKMARHHGKWARRRGLEAFRVYDGDLDAFPLSVDRYGAQLYVSVYKGAAPESLERYGTLIAEALEVPAAALHFKVRERQTGSNQYEKLDADGREFPVAEYGRRFYVNLTDYLDTGLFLDHRETRRMVGEAARDKRVLNLFAYTCSFGVYAATAGATRVENVDLSNTYLDWGQRNFTLNGLDPTRYGFLRADALEFLREAQVPAEYDLIVLDPPTFSNSKMMRDVLDTQRDHADLINGSLRRLAPGGTLYFSTNYRKFKLDEGELRGKAREITAQTLPPDFRQYNLHRCWRITHAD